MKIAVPCEVHENECRVAITPDITRQLIKLGFSVSVENNAGLKASFSDAAYIESGAEIVHDTKLLWQEADVILKVRAPEMHPDLGVDEVSFLGPSKTLISFVWPGQNAKLLERLAETGANVLAMDSIPRISRAQKMDALSSMANIAGYRAIIEAANRFGRFFTGQITAAGKVPPAKVMVIGAGVAGLAAISAAKSLGAIVRAFDTRPEVKEQVESMNAEFLELNFSEDGSGQGGYAKTMSAEFIEAEMALFAAQALEVDIIVTTALIPGKPAPKLITEEMVASMRSGSVIVDLAAEQGGNCVSTVPGEVTLAHGVTIIGFTDLPSRLATQSSQLYGNNVRHLLGEIMKTSDDQHIHIDMNDEAIRGATIVNGGEITWPPPVPKLSAGAGTKAAQPKDEVVLVRNKKPWPKYLALSISALRFLWLGSVAPSEFMSHFTVFVLACFIGYQVIWNVTPALHTPLMSVTNAISGIIVIGAVLQLSSEVPLVLFLSSFAVMIATINIVGGFHVTQRMLRMFQRGKE
jgi:H+-translocating NAD(P) transhydrogenase subunit alpha